MSLIKSATANFFDGTSIKCGACIRARRTIWDDFKNGFVTDISDNTATVLYYVEPGNAANYFTIDANEVAAGLWQIYWTQDMQSVNTEGVTTSA
jgi:hypothetical protein